MAIAAGFAAAAVVATGFGIFGLQKADEAEENAAVAQQREQEAEQAAAEAQARSLLSAATAAMDEDPALALLLASQGIQSGLHDPQAVSVLRDAVRDANTIYFDEISIHAAGSLNLGEISPDGRHLLVGVDANIIEMRDIASGEVVWTYDAGLPEDGHIWTRSTFVDGGNEVAVTVAFEAEDSDPTLELPENKGIQVLDRETGGLLRTIDPWECGPTLEPFNPNLGNSRIVVVVPTDEWHAEYGCAFEPGTIRILGQNHVVDVSTGESIPVGPVYNLDSAFPSFDYDESFRRRVLWEPNGPTLTVLDAETDQELMRIEGANRSEIVAMSPDGTLAVSGGAQENNETPLFVYEVDSGDVVAVLAGHAGSTNTLKFVDGGTRLISSGDDGLIKVWNPHTGELLDTIITGEGNKWTFSLTDDESQLAVFGNTVTVVSLDSASTAEVGVLDSCGDTSVFYAGAGLVVRGDKALAYAGCELEPGLLEPDPFKVFDLETRSLVYEGRGGSTQGVDLSPDGRFIAGQRWTPETDTNPSLVGPVEVTDTTDGTVVVMDGLCEWIEGSDGEGPNCVAPPGEPYAAYAHDIRFSPDGLMVSMSGGSGGPGRIWHAHSGESVASWEFHSGQFSPDGSRFVSINFDEGLLQVRDTSDFSVVAERELQDEDPWIEHLQVTMDGTMVVGADLNGLAIYEIEDLTVVRTMPNLHESFIRHVALSEDGTMVATAGRDGFAKVWDIESGTLLHEIHASEDDRVQAVAFADEDDHLLVSVAGGPLAIYSLNIDELLAIAGDRLVRGFNETECDVYFPDLPCPTLEEIRSG